MSRIIQIIGALMKRHVIFTTSYQDSFARHVMRSKINEDSGLQWPKGDDGCILPVIEMILGLKCNNNVDAEWRWYCKYNTKETYDSMQVFRNHHKHFYDLPSYVKVLFWSCTLCSYLPTEMVPSYLIKLICLLGYSLATSLS
jgi:hypothetical protein